MYTNEKRPTILLNFNHSVEFVIFLSGEIESVKMIKIKVHSPKWLIILSTGSGPNLLKII